MRFETAVQQDKCPAGRLLVSRCELGRMGPRTSAGEHRCRTARHTVFVAASS